MHQQYQIVSLPDFERKHGYIGLNTSMDAINSDPLKYYALALDTITLVVLTSYQEGLSKNPSTNSKTNPQAQLICTRPQDVTDGSFVPPTFAETFLNQTAKNHTSSGSSIMFHAVSRWEILATCVVISFVSLYL